MEVSKSLNEFYPDLIALGGLANALRSAFCEIDSPLAVSELDKNMRFVVYARIESGSRSSQIYVAAERRLFLFDFWARGVQFARGATPDLVATSRSIHKWATSNCSTAQLAAEYSFVSVNADATAYERGEEVEARWQSMIQDCHHLELVPFIHAASNRPKLRQLFPFTSLVTFCFSRCTGYPYTADTPYVRPLPDGRYIVVSASGKVIGRGDADEAADLVVRNLRPNCGPAVPGTAEDVGRETP